MWPELNNKISFRDQTLIRAFLFGPWPVIYAKKSPWMFFFMASIIETLGFVDIEQSLRDVSWSSGCRSRTMSPRCLLLARYLPQEKSMNVFFHGFNHWNHRLVDIEQSLRDVSWSSGCRSRTMSPRCLLAAFIFILTLLVSVWNSHLPYFLWILASLSFLRRPLLNFPF
jgi:hypothetical protein